MIEIVFSKYTVYYLLKFHKLYLSSIYGIMKMNSNFLLEKKVFVSKEHGEVIEEKNGIK